MKKHPKEEMSKHSKKMKEEKKESHHKVKDMKSHHKKKSKWLKRKRYLIADENGPKKVGKYYTNGPEIKFIKFDEIVPEGFIRGKKLKWKFYQEMDLKNLMVY